MPDFEPLPGEPRLDSWKAIAAHLERDVRTAKRWEVHEGLPVRRHRHLARSTVYAYPREIEQWREGRLPGATSAAPRPLDVGRRWLLLATGVAMSVLAAGGGRFMEPIAVSAQSGNLTATRMTWPEGEEPFPLGAVSFHGGYLAFPNNDTALATRDLASGEVAVVPNASGWRDGQVEFVRPSARGDVIAYTWFDFSAGRYELRTISRTGGEPRIIQTDDDTAYVRPLAWTPDGSRVIASIDGEETVTLSAVSVEPSRPEQVIARFRDGSVQAADVSRDGRWMAYDYAPGRNDQRDIFVARLDVARLDEGAPSALVATDASEVVLGWLPDGRHLMYLSNASGTIGAWIVRVTDGRADGEPVFVNGDLGRFEGLGFTADGRFYSEVLVGGSDVQSVPLDRRTGLASGEPKPLPGRQPGVRRAQGTWSATGDRLAFFRSAPMSPTALGIHDRATGRLETFPLPVWNLERPNWHPDGRRIVVVGRDGVNQACAFEVDLDSGSVTCITDRTPYAVYTPDGVYLIYRRPRSDDAPAVIVRRRLSDDNEEVIFTGPGGFVLSPNGERLLLYRGRAGQPDAQEATASLSVVPVSGGSPTLSTSTRSARTAGTPTT
jgi:Tol biopolymer transport system component